MKPDKKERLNDEDSGPVRLMLAYLCTATLDKEATLTTKVEVLNRFGLSNLDIATVCASTVQSIKNVRSSLRKSKEGNKSAG